MDRGALRGFLERRLFTGDISCILSGSIAYRHLFERICSICRWQHASGYFNAGLSTFWSLTFDEEELH